nr:hypothetical protein WG33_0385 [uncultured bacterium]
MRLVHRLVRQHGLAHDVADGEDVRHIGAHLRLNSLSPAGIERRGGRLTDGLDWVSQTDADDAYIATVAHM